MEAASVQYVSRISVLEETLANYEKSAASITDPQSIHAFTMLQAMIKSEILTLQCGPDTPCMAPPTRREHVG
jgi:hypothetical protein